MLYYLHNGVFYCFVAYYKVIVGALLEKTMTNIHFGIAPLRIGRTVEDTLELENIDFGYCGCDDEDGWYKEMKWAESEAFFLGNRQQKICYLS